MYKVLIVEDEPPISRMVKSAVENADDDFKVEKCCYNGAEAVAALKSEHFDVVITDIKMPVMDGIELSGWLYKNRPDIEVVILSGYREFDYAHAAIEFKVFDYLLKPVSKAKATELTKRLRAELEKKSGSATYDDDMNTVTVLACAGAYLLYGANALIPGEQFWTDNEARTYIENTLTESEEYIFFNTNTQSELFVVIGTETHDRQEEIVRGLFEHITGRGIPITVVYKTGVLFKDSGKSLSLLREQLVKKLILDRDGLICCDGVKDVFEGIGHPYSKIEIDGIVSAIRSGNQASVRERLCEILYRMRASDCTQEEAMGLLNMVADTFSVTHPNLLKRKNTSIKNELALAAAGFTSYESFVEDVVSVFLTMRGDDLPEDRYSKLADEIEAYLIENYAKSITSDTLSKRFGFVPSYISRIFKSSKGISPSEFLTRYRISLAKQIMSEQPDIMIKEIADMVGFKEPYYFSKTFKKETGMWPTEYIK